MNTLAAAVGPELLSVLVGVISLLAARLIQKYLPDESAVLVPAIDHVAASLTHGEQTTAPPAPKGDEQ